MTRPIPSSFKRSSLLHLRPSLPRYDSSTGQEHQCRSGAGSCFSACSSRPALRAFTLGLFSVNRRTQLLRLSRNAAVPVAVSVAEIRDVAIILRGLGSVTAYATVDVKARSRREHHQGRFSRGSGSQNRRSPDSTRPAPLSGGSCASKRDACARSSKFGECARRPRPLREACEGQLRFQTAVLKSAGHGERSRGDDRGRSVDDRGRRDSTSNIVRSHLRSPKSSAFARSTSGT